MPAMCFSYPADIRPGIGNRNIAQPDLRNPRMMPHTCFGYPADVPRSMPFACFSYPYLCFSYPDDAPLGNGNRDGAQPTSPELRSMPYPCFRY
jgi:hypothetical protein